MGLEATDFGDTTVPDPQVGAKAGQPGTVDDRSIHYHGVEFRHWTVSYGSNRFAHQYESEFSILNGDSNSHQHQAFANLKFEA
jgi:hypothetical protein